jgi:ElaB/YqjD/DUF883 family membrane-anchored ribosome-binding protein
MTPQSTMNDLHPGMMGDGTEEQNLGQRGNPGARITQDEVEEAFSGQRPPEGRSFDESAAEGWNSLKDHAATVRDNLAGSASAMRDWAADQAQAAKQTAADKPLLVVSVSAGAALAVGLALGFVLGRASDDF